MKKRILSAVFAAALCVLSGCSGATIYSDYREVADIEIIRTIGIDTENGKIIIAASTGAGSDAQEPKIFRAEGDTVSDAMRDIQTTPIGHNLYFAHAEHILIGEEAAKEGIEAYLDFVERASEMRLNTNIYIVRADTAEGILKGCSGKGSSATDMLSFLQRNVKNLGQGYVYTCEDVAAELAVRGNALIMAVKSEETNFITGDGDGQILVPAGFAVMKDGKLEGYLTEEETRGTALLTEKIVFDNAPIEIDGGKVSLGLSGEKVEITPETENGELKSVRIDIGIEANVEEVSGKPDISDNALRRRLTEKLARLEAERAAAAVKRAQTMGIDFLGIGDAALRAEPTEFAAAEREWESIFPQTTFNINVSAVIRRSYDIENPINVSGKEDEKFWVPTTK